jgi:hypothetical protein
MNDNTSESTQRSAPNKKLRSALIRAIAAALLAAVFLSATGFGVFELLGRPTDAKQVQDEEGVFVYSDINIILGFYAEELTNGKLIARYGLIPMAGKFVTVRFTERYFESADSVCDSTYDYVNGKISSLDGFITVQGTFKRISEEVSGYMYDWFGVNREQLVSMGVIYETDDYADFLSDNIIEVDVINGMAQSKLISFSAVSGALLLYMLVELILMGAGFYLPKAEKEKRKKAAETLAAEAYSESEIRNAAAEQDNAYVTLVETYSEFPDGETASGHTEADAVYDGEDSGEDNY